MSDFLTGLLIIAALGIAIGAYPTEGESASRRDDGTCRTLIDAPYLTMNAAGLIERRQPLMFLPCDETQLVWAWRSV